MVCFIRQVLFYTMLLGMFGCGTMQTGELAEEVEALGTPAGKAQYAWIQYDMNAAASARAIVLGAAADCPQISIDGAAATPNVYSHNAHNV